MYCYDCAQLACAECLIERHTQHQYEYVRKVVTKYRKVLENESALLEETGRDYARALGDIQNRREEIVRQCERVRQTTHDAFDHAQRVLEEAKAALLRKATEITELKLSSLRDQEQQITHSLSNLEKVSGLVDAFMTDPYKHEELICSFQNIQDTVNHQIEIFRTVHLDPLEIPDVVVNVTSIRSMIDICQAKPPNVFTSTIYRPGTSQSEVGVAESILLRPKTENSSINVSLKSLSCQGTVLAHVARKNSHLYEALFAPTVRGRHTLCVEVGGQPISCSPIPLFVSMPPSLIRHPVKVLAYINTPTCVALNSKGELVVTEWCTNQVSIRDKQGRKLLELRGHVFERPFGVAVDHEDNIYVSEEAANRISKFARNGTFVQSVGTVGDNPGQFRSPRGLRLINNKLYICDRENDRVQVFDRELHFLECIGGRGTPYKWATDLVASPEGLLYIAGTDISDVHVVSLADFSTANSVHHITLLCPTGVCFDPTHQYLYVVDFNYHCVFVFTRDGAFISKFGGEGIGEGQLNFPRGIAIDEDGYVYVCDTQNNRIQIF